MNHKLIKNLDLIFARTAFTALCIGIVLAYGPVFYLQAMYFISLVFK